MTAEHFIPLRKTELAAHLLAMPDLPESERTVLARLFDRLSTAIHAGFYRRLEALKDLYAPFDPDLPQTQPYPSAARATRERMSELFDEFEELALCANYRVLTLADLNAALSSCSHWGLNLELDITAFERLEIYARGNVVGKRGRRRLRKGWQFEETEVAVYERLIVMFRLAPRKRIRRHLDANSAFIKLFKEIPQLDLDMLLPATRVRMTPIDRIKILVPTLSGLGIALWKVFQGALWAAFAGIYGLLAVLGLVGGTIGYGIRSFYGYLNTKNKYQLSLTESLYYQNLDNNAGVFFRLLDEAEEQETCEAMLAYYFLWRGGAEGMSGEQLDAAVEQFLDGLAGRAVDFEVNDALAKLYQFGLAEQTDGLVRTTAPGAALDKFRENSAAPPSLGSGVVR